jgi:hypothetical protein
MDIFISSDRHQEKFITPVLEAVRSKADRLRDEGIDMNPVYPPWNIGRVPSSMVERINQIRDAHVVLMNVTPIGSIKRVINENEIEDFCVNSGVSIEFGILMGIGRLEKCHLFCSSKFGVGNISPIYHGQNIDRFDPDKPDLLKETVELYLTEHLGKMDEKYERYASNSSSARA